MVGYGRSHWHGWCWCGSTHVKVGRRFMFWGSELCSLVTWPDSSIWEGGVSWWELGMGVGPKKEASWWAYGSDEDGPCCFPAAELGMAWPSLLPLPPISLQVCDHRFWHVTQAETSALPSINKHCCREYNSSDTPVRAVLADALLSQICNRHNKNTISTGFAGQVVKQVFLYPCWKIL